jgi:assimilatory nitrate reductase catalytic subunit
MAPLDASASASGPTGGCTVRTTCPYCGVGCGVAATPDGVGGAVIAGDPRHPANAGRLCSKGSALGQTLSLEDRLLHPEIDGRRVDWPTALDTVASGLAETIERHGPEAVAFYVSGQLLTEDYYAANKLIKGFLGSASIDTNSRLCMASSVAGHRRAFGSDTVPGLYEDLELAEMVVLVGSNLAWCHPILFQRLAAAKERRPQLEIWVVDPRRTETCEIADQHLKLAPGSDVALFNGLLAALDRAGAIDQRYVKRHTYGIQDALVAARTTTPDVAATARLCDVVPSEIERFFAVFARSRRVVTVYSQGVNQSSAGVDKVNAIINCHLLTGRIGRPGMGPFSVTGQPNAMGGREVGALSNQLAAHMDFAPADLDRVRRFWNAPRLAARPGLKAVELFDAMGQGRIKAVWIMATNPLVSLPNAGAAQRALEQCGLSIVSDVVRNSDTVDRCRIRLPALAWGEKDGTVTNSERCISRQRPFLRAPGEARPDWWIVAEVARRLGFGEAFDWRGPADIFREHAALSAFENEGARDFDIGALADMDDAEYAAMDPVIWPAPRGASPARQRFFGAGGFFHSDRLARFVPVAPKPPAHAPDERHALRLNTGRVRDHWHTMTRTGKAPRLASHRAEPFLEVHPEDAARFGLQHGGIAEIASTWGTALARVSITDAVRPGEVFAPMHWTAQVAARGRINETVNPAVDPVSGQPELKHTPVSVQPWPARWHGFVLSRRRIDAAGLGYWVSARGEDHWSYDLADCSEVDGAWQAIWSSLRQGHAGVELVYEDRASGRYRGALLREGRLDVVCFVAPRRDISARTWLAGLFANATLSSDDRRGLLVGRPGAATCDAGPQVCACFAVGRTTIIDAIAAQKLGSVEAVGQALQAGTNCGSCRPEIAVLLRLAARAEAA